MSAVNAKGAQGPSAWIVPRWPAPTQVRALVTTRAGGVSQGPYASLNLGAHVGDDPVAVEENRARVRKRLPAEPLWLNQVHGTRVVDAAHMRPGEEADGAVSRAPGRVLAILSADCLPVILADREGTAVGAAHAGWRGLAAGVIENTVAAMKLPGERLVAWLGPAIGPKVYEVGAEVREAFVTADAQADSAFRDQGRGKFLADLYLLARQRLARLGVVETGGGDACTFSEPGRFFSYRRDGQAGRMATLVWLQ